MTMVVAMWCRHKGDDIIGINNQLPWSIPSDGKKFLDVVEGQNVVLGRKTYESLPQKTVGESKLFVFTTQSGYELYDYKNQHIVCSQKELADLLEEDEDLYVAGGAEIYQLFMDGKEKLKPHIIVDCVYEGDLLGKVGVMVNIKSVIETMSKKYKKITPDYCLDNVASAIWVRKGEFIEQSVLKRIICILEREAVLR